jgi:protein-S-isoprenylcysteine O-methyltransferase Ste14
MITGLCFVLIGVLFLFYPQILIAFVSGLLILFGLGMMATSWQFRRMQKQSESRFINWIIRW